MTSSTAITILGLGPGRWEDLTLQAQAALEQAAKDQNTIFFRTIIHPIIEPLKQALPDLHITSFDPLYDEATNWDMLYRRIAEEICMQAEVHAPVLYAVPGHPMIGDTSVQCILQEARKRDLHVTIVAGLSFLEPVCTALELDPIASGMQIIDATDLATLSPDEIAGKIIPTVPLLVTHIYNRRQASSVKLALGECFHDEWPIKLVRSTTSASSATVGEQGGGKPGPYNRTSETVIGMPLYQLDHEKYANQFNTLYVPPAGALEALRVPETLRYITMRLRREPDGCPWDRQQTHQTLTRYVIEETYEVVEALEENNMEKLAEELGDLLLQVYLHAEIARQEGDFNIGDVYEHVSAKLIRRHPHVFGQIEVENAGQVVQNWEEIKRQERIAAGKDVESESILDGVPLASPALIVAQQYQKRAAKVGFDYDNLQQVLAKLTEELQELQEATTPEHTYEEMGDVLFMVARIARELDIDAEEALRSANRKFRRRFRAMEHITRTEGRTFSSYDLDGWRNLWNRVKN